jgi:PPOX class probable F420-dependent enzyme
MDQHQARDRFAAQPVVRFATVGPDGRPHLVPVTFAVMPDGGDGVIVFAIDHKPKSTTALRRLRIIALSQMVAFLADHYAADWSVLWWVRADAVAEVLPAGGSDPRFGLATLALSERYPQYRQRPPGGPVVWSTVTHWSGWQATA